MKNILKQIKYGFQRMLRGYDDNEISDIEYSFVKRYIKILTDFKNRTDICPLGISLKELTDIVDEMINHLKLMNEEYVIKELCKDMPADYHPDYETIVRIMLNNKNEFFKLFSQYFTDLWCIGVIK